MTSVAQNSEISEGVVPRGSRKEPPGRSKKCKQKVVYCVANVSCFFC